MNLSDAIAIFYHANMKKVLWRYLIRRVYCLYQGRSHRYSAQLDANRFTHHRNRKSVVQFHRLRFHHSEYSFQLPVLRLVVLFYYTMFTSLQQLAVQLPTANVILFVKITTNLMQFIYIRMYVLQWGWIAFCLTREVRENICPPLLRCCVRRKCISTKGVKQRNTKRTVFALDLAVFLLCLIAWNKTDESCS